MEAIEDLVKSNDLKLDRIVHYSSGNWGVMVYRDYPKDKRFREVFQETTIYRLYNAIQSRIVQGRVRVEPGA